MDWDKLLRKEVKPPWIPDVGGKESIKQIDPTFTSERPTLSEPNEPTGKLNSDAQQKFEGFTFVPDSELRRK